MPSFRTRRVVSILSERPGLQRVELEHDGPAYVLTQLIGDVAVGDEVVVNTTAVDLGLGTGGWHVVHWNLARRDLHQPGPGHIMKIAPQTTRARLRGEFIKKAKERKRDYTVDWVHLKLNDQAQRTVLCKDPFKSHDERVDKLIESL